MLTKEEVLKIKEKYEAYLLGIGGVVIVGANQSIIIYVEQLTPKLAAFLPRTLDGAPVRIIETKGKIVPLSLLAPPIPVAHAIYALRTDRYRPAPGGVSCGHPSISAGTLSCRARDKLTGEMILGLSNNHVIALRYGEMQVGEKGDSTLQPGPYDGGTDPLDKIGELERWMPVTLEEANLVDAAVFRSDELSEEVLEVGKPSNTINPIVGMQVKKSGRTSGLTFSKIIDVHATVRVEGWGVATFKDQVVCMPAFAWPGDSGSWCGDMNDRTVGLVHAGSTEVSVVCKGLHIERLLNLEIFPPYPVEYIPWYTMLGVWGSVFTIGQGTLRTLKPPKEGYVM